MNTKLLRRVAKHILAEPKRFDMEVVGVVRLPDSDEDAPACGTVGCIAGWAALLSLPDDVIPTSPIDRAALMTWPTAEKALELTANQAYRLFNEPWQVYGKRARDEALGWPVLFAKRYLNAKSMRGRAKIAAERIEHFIKTNGRE